MRYLSLFSGIEAATMAWKPLGWKATAFAEIEPFPCAVLAHHYPEVMNLGDVTKADYESVGPVDLVVFGSPCQSFSVAGKRLGLDDPRGNLALYALGVVARLRPRWFLFENVPGLLSSGDGRDFGSFLGTVGECGYGWAYRTLDAQYFGVPQRRRRVFVVGCLGDWRLAAAVLFERHSLQGHPAPSRETGERPAPTISARTQGGGGLGTDFDCDGGLVTALPVTSRVDRGGTHREARGNNLVVAPELARCIATREGTSQDWETTAMVAHSLRADGFDASEDGTGRGTPLVPVAHCDVMPTMMNGANTPAGHMARSGHSKDQYIVPMSFDMTQDRSQPAFGEPCHTLARGSHPPAIAFDWQSGGDVCHNVSEHHTSALQRCQVPAIGFRPNATTDVFGDGAGAVTTNSGSGNLQAAAVGMQVRRLTPRECERLQGFPDDFTLVPYRGKPASDGPRYKALGNSMAVPVVRWIGERITLAESQVAA